MHFYTKSCTIAVQTIFHRSNIIAETGKDGKSKARFIPVPAFMTADAMEQLCSSFITAMQDGKYDPLLLIPMFIMDFLCIHPFNDGNGRMSRLLTLLLLYRCGYIVGKYISVEMLIEKSKEHEAHLAAEAKREADARLTRYNGVLDKFISEGHKAQRVFALSDRCGDFNSQEALSVYYAIVALAQKLEISLDCNSGIKSVTTQFLDGFNWSGMSQNRQDNCRSWTNLFTAREVDFPESVIGNFCTFVDHMSCSAETYVSLGGSNGCADQLTNWDSTQKKVWAHQRKKTKECLCRVLSITGS